METALIVISVLLIVLVLLQSNKAQQAGGQIISGGNADLFQNQKERGAELLITRLTLVLGVAFFVLSLILYLK